MSFWANRCNHVGGTHYEQFPPRCERDGKNHDLPHWVRANGATFYWDDEGVLVIVLENGKKV